MDETKSKAELLDPQVRDYVASAVRGFVGTVPFAGSLLAEIAGTIIPNQRLDRIAKFAVILEGRLSVLERKYVEAQLTDEHFTDLMEEGMRQAARSLSDERREYIATLIANSLSAEDIEYWESKHLLRLLDETNDVEVVWLRSYAHELVTGDEMFREKHKGILGHIPAYLGSSQNVLDDKTLQQSYKNHLVHLGLLEPLYRVDNRTGLLELEERGGGGTLSVRNYRITPLGRLLLREIGLYSINKTSE